MSVELHGKQAQESTVLIDTTVQEKNITYPTDAKLAEVFLISFKQAVCGKFALQFSDEFVGNGSKAC
jgi:hypothetical protein